jgi:hypothetical protein
MARSLRRRIVPASRPTSVERSSHGPSWRPHDDASQRKETHGTEGRATALLKASPRQVHQTWPEADAAMAAPSSLPANRGVCTAHGHADVPTTCLRFVDLGQLDLRDVPGFGALPSRQPTLESHQEQMLDLYNTGGDQGLQSEQVFKTIWSDPGVIDDPVGAWATDSTLDACREELPNRSTPIARLRQPSLLVSCCSPLAAPA